MNTTCHIEVGPELNIVHAAETRQSWLSLIEPAHQVIEVDLSGVQEMDSAGLQLLLSLSKSSMQEGKQLQLIKPSRVVREVIELFDLGDHFAPSESH